MAKGDAGAAQNQINQQNKIAQFGTGNGNEGLTGLQNQFKQQYQATQPQYQNALNQASQDYGNIMGGYQNFMQNIGQNNPLAGLSYGGGAGLINQGEVGSAMKGYQNFADTGGFTPQNIGAMQQAAMAPIRGAYQQAQGAVQQGQGLAGGYSPNLAAAQAQMARQQGQQMSQAEIGSQANIANLVQQGKLAGLGGLSQTALQNQAEALQAAAINNQYNLGLGGLNLQNAMMQGQQALGGLSGMQGMYSATPGRANMLQNYLSNIQGLQQGAQGLQNQLSLGTMQNQIAKSGIPSNFQQAMSNIGSVTGLLSKLGQGLGGLTGGGNNPASFIPGAGQGGDQGPATPSNYQYPIDPNAGDFGTGQMNPFGSGNYYGQPVDFGNPGMGGYQYPGGYNDTDIYNTDQSNWGG